MRQVLFVGAGHSFPEGAFHFLYQMQLQERVHVRGLFFQPYDYTGTTALWPSGEHSRVVQSEAREKTMIEEQKATLARNCEQHYILYDIHENDREWDRTLFARESRFADLVLISAERFYSDQESDQPNAYLRDALHAAECPVVIVPDTFEKVRHLFMAYDGSRESLFAIKQFCYLFPQMTDLPTEIVYSKDEETSVMPEEAPLKRFTQTKFDCMSFTKLHFDPYTFFSTWIGDKKNVMLASGSFGRSSMSYVARRSFAEDVVHDHKVPVFVAHC